jgi:hypothetical protein
MIPPIEDDGEADSVAWVAQDGAVAAGGRRGRLFQLMYASQGVRAAIVHPPVIFGQICTSASK